MPEVSIFEARRILGRLQERRGHLYDIVSAVHGRMGAYISNPVPVDVTVNVEEGGEANIGGEPPGPPTAEDVQNYRERLEPIINELEELDAKIVGIEMALKKAELDTQVSIDV